MQDEILPDQRSGHQSDPPPPRYRPGRPRRSEIGWLRTSELRALGTAVRETRARRGLSQEQLGEEADLHRNYIGAIERGEINPTFRILLLLARGLHVSLAALIVLYEKRRVDELPVPLTGPALARTDDQ